MITLILGFILFFIGLWAMMTRKNLIKIILGFSIIDTGIHLIIVSIGYLKERTAPILDKSVELKEAAEKVVDPIPSALVLTAIVIGLAVTAFMLSYVIKMYEKKKSLSIDDYKELKW